METDNLPISLNLEISSGISSESSSPSSPSLLELIDPILLNDSTHLARSQTAADQRPATSTVSETPWSPEYAFKGVTSQQFAIERGEVEMRMESDGDSEDERYEYYPTLSSGGSRSSRSLRSTDPRNRIYSQMLNEGIVSLSNSVLSAVSTTTRKVVYRKSERVKEVAPEDPRGSINQQECVASLFSSCLH